MRRDTPPAPRNSAPRPANSNAWRVCRSACWAICSSCSERPLCGRVGLHRDAVAAGSGMAAAIGFSAPRFGAVSATGNSVGRAGRLAAGGRRLLQNRPTAGPDRGRRSELLGASDGSAVCAANLKATPTTANPSANDIIRKRRFIGFLGFTGTRPEWREKGTGTICAQHPPGRSGKWCLSPFPARGACQLQGPFLC